MEIVRSAKPTRETANVKIWHCGGCKVVHMSVRDIVLNFTREEFAAFTEAVVDSNYSGWDVHRDRVLDLTDHDADFYANAVLQ